MLVRFISSETGELIMFAETARILLMAMGKQCTAKGVITRQEMLPAADALRKAVQAEASEDMPSSRPEEEIEAGQHEPKISLARRAWPLIDMLERSAHGREKAHVLWKASADFGT